MGYHPIYAVQNSILFWFVGDANSYCLLLSVLMIIVCIFGVL